MCDNAKTNYEREPIFWLVKFLQAHERGHAAAEREAQSRLAGLGFGIAWRDPGRELAGFRKPRKGVARG